MSARGIPGSVNDASTGGCVLPSGPSGSDGPGPHPDGAPGVNDDMVAFGEIVSDAEVAKFMDEFDRGEHPLSLEDEAALARSKPLLVEQLRVIDLNREIAAAHAACDSSVRRDNGQHPYSLADRIKGMRRMIDDYQCWLREAEQLLEKLPRGKYGVTAIVWFSIGSIVGAFLAWGFLALS